MTSAVRRRFSDARYRVWGAAAVAFLLVLAIALAVGQGAAAPLDHALLLAAKPSRLALSSALALTWLGDSARRFAILAVAVGVLIVCRRWRMALWMSFAVLAGAAANSGLKWLVARPRPDLLPHLDAVTSHSFPSGHAAGAVVLWLALALALPARLRRPAYLVAAAAVIGTGLSRIVLAVHWPSDVAAGWLFGFGWVLLWRPLLGRRG